MEEAGDRIFKVARPLVSPWRWWLASLNLTRLTAVELGQLRRE
jgi:hypothetical protein